MFFDNVGGETLEAALNHLNMRSRVVMCGGIANYNATTPQPGPTNIMNLVIMRSRMEGFIVLDYLPRAGEAIKDLLGWIGEASSSTRSTCRKGSRTSQPPCSACLRAKILVNSYLRSLTPSRSAPAFAGEPRYA